MSSADDAIHCPACNAIVGEMSWCPQCWAPVKPQPSADPDFVLPRAAEEENEQRKWPCTHCEHLNSYDKLECENCGSKFLATLHEQDKPTGLWGTIVNKGRAARLGVAMAIILAVLAPLAFIVWWLS